MAGDANGRSDEGNGSLPREVADGLREAGGREGLLSRIPDKGALKELADLHQALSDPVRLQIVHLLGASELCPCVLKDLTASRIPSCPITLASWRRPNWPCGGRTRTGAYIV